MIRAQVPWVVIHQLTRNGMQTQAIAVAKCTPNLWDVTVMPYDQGNRTEGVMEEILDIHPAATARIGDQHFLVGADRIAAALGIQRCNVFRFMHLDDDPLPAEKHGHEVVVNVTDLEWWHKRNVDNRIVNPRPLNKKRRPRPKMTIGRSIRYRILARDRFRCQACGATAKERRLHIDHVIPEARGGLTVDENLVALCEDCNMGKRDLHPGNPLGRYAPIPIGCRR